MLDISMEIQKDIGEEIIQKLKLLNKKLDKILEGGENGKEKLSDSCVSRN